MIESKTKPSKPSGEIAQTAFGAVPTATDRGQVDQAILAVGRKTSIRPAFKSGAASRSWVPEVTTSSSTRVVVAYASAQRSRST